MNKKNIVLNNFNEINNKKNDFLNSKYERFIVDYKVVDDHIRIYSNIGEYRTVKNTKDNLSKVNYAVIKNKIAIANKIDDYEKNERRRFYLLLFNLLFLCLSGLLVPLAFFTGVYLLFVCSIVFFGISVITVSICGTEYYILVNEISNLKKITGYKKSVELTLPKVNIKALESHQ